MSLLRTSPDLSAIPAARSKGRRKYVSADGIVFEGETLVARGPFPYFRHPNYMLVVAEIIVAPMVLGLWCVAVVYLVLNVRMTGCPKCAPQGRFQACAHSRTRADTCHELRSTLRA